MKALTCEMCGSTNLIKQDGVFVCQQCGTKYSLEEARKMMIEGTVSVQGTVSVDNSSLLQNLYVLGRRALTNESIEALDYYKRILEMDPYSKEAIVVTQLVGIDNSRNLSYVGSGEDCVNAMSEEEKSYYLNLLKPIFVSKGCYALSTDIQRGLVDIYHSLWGNCFVEAWCESAKETLDDLYDAYTRSLDSEPFDDKHLLTALMSYPVIVAAIQKINPTQDLIEENNRIALMRSKKEELDREAERTKQERIAAEERAERERIAAEERAERERIAAAEREDFKNKRLALYSLSSICIFWGLIGFRDSNIVKVNICFALSFFLSLVICVIHIINQLPAKWHLLVMVILIGATAYFNYIYRKTTYCIDREITYTIECPKCGSIVEIKTPYYGEIVKDEEDLTRCHKCDNLFVTKFTNCSFFGNPIPTGTYYNDYCIRNNKDLERARKGLPVTYGI